MSSRDELIEAGADTLPGGYLRANRELAAAVIDKVEPLIRADEQVLMSARIQAAITELLGDDE